MRRQRRLVAAAAIALAFAIGVVPVAAGDRTFKATRPFVVEKQTGVVRMPTEQEVKVVVETLSTLAARPENLAETAAQDGTVTVDLAGGFGGVVLARPGENGTWETLCVFSLDEGAAFLGLVEVKE